MLPNPPRFCSRSGSVPLAERLLLLLFQLRPRRVVGIPFRGPARPLLQGSRRPPFRPRSRVLLLLLKSFLLLVSRCRPLFTPFLFRLTWRRFQGAFPPALTRLPSFRPSLPSTPWFSPRGRLTVVTLLVPGPVRVTRVTLVLFHFLVVTGFLSGFLVLIKPFRGQFQCQPFPFVLGLLILEFTL